jgi:hypothetical protein
LLVIGGLGAVALIASLYVIVVLEIVKWRRASSVVGRSGFGLGASGLGLRRATKRRGAAPPEPGFPPNDAVHQHREPAGVALHDEPLWHTTGARRSPAGEIRDQGGG